MDEKKGLYALWKGVSQRAGDRRSGLLLLAGLAGMVLILLSALPGSGGGEAAPSQPPDTQAYLEELGYAGPYMIEMWYEPGTDDVERISAAQSWLERQFQAGLAKMSVARKGAAT